MPDILLEHGKAANPWPNVDAHSGVLLQVCCHIVIPSPGGTTQGPVINHTIHTLAHSDVFTYDEPSANMRANLLYISCARVMDKKGGIISSVNSGCPFLKCLCY